MTVADDRSKKDYRKGTEFGGVAGLIQPSPHDPADSPSETRMMIMKMNPAAGFPLGLNPEENELPPSTKKIS